MSPKFLRALVALCVFSMATSYATAQVDQELNLGSTPFKFSPAKANVGRAPDTSGVINGTDPLISPIPRYYLNTADVLSRETDDSTRPAPGLAKNNYIAKAYEIRNTRAIEIQSYLLRTLSYEAGIAEVMGLGGVDGDGPSAQILIVTMPDHMEPYIDQIIEVTDVPGFKFYDATGRANDDGVPGAVQYVGKHRTASELVNILGGTELGNVGVYLFPPFADDSTNSIYIVENPTDIADDILALEMFDKPPLQVNLKVRVTAWDDSDIQELGLDWDSWKRHISGDLTYEYLRPELDDSFDMASFSTLLSVDALALTEFVNFMVSDNDVEVVTETSITMVNSEDVGFGLSRGSATQTAATISTGGTISYTLADQVLEAEDGITISILPFIGTESVTLDVDVSVASLVGFSPDGVPLTKTAESSSVLNLKPGETKVLGGLERSGTTATTRGFPFLKDIPVLKYLFANESKGKISEKILIEITPEYVM